MALSIWFGVILYGSAIPLPEGLKSKPGAIIKITLSEGETEEDLSRRLELHAELIRDWYTLRLAYKEHNIAELPVAHQVLDLPVWLGDYLELEVDEERGLIRVWFQQGSTAERVAISNAIVDGYLSRLNREQGERESAKSRIPQIQQALESEAMQILIAEEQSALLTEQWKRDGKPRHLEQMERNDRAIKRAQRAISRLEGQLAEATRDLEDLMSAQVLSTAVDPNVTRE